MKMRKAGIRLLIVLLIFALHGSVLPAKAMAESQSGDFTYAVLNDGTAEITEYSGAASRLTIPDELGGHTVTRIGDKVFESCTKLSELTIPSSVTSIGNGAYSGCTSLMGHRIPDSVTSIGNNAYSNCTSLTGVVIPDSVVNIGDKAFFGCSNLSYVQIGLGLTQIGSNPFAMCFRLSEIDVSPNHPSLEVIKSVIFLKAEKRLICRPAGLNSKKYVIPNGTKSIGDYAFSGCTNLTNVSIPGTVTSIGSSAFHNCDSLTNIEIGKEVIEIGSNPFAGCDSLSMINLSPDHPTLELIDGVLCLKDGEQLVSYPPALTAMTIYVIPDGIQSIGNGAFKNCISLNGLTIPDSVTSIGDSAFEGCTSLTDLIIPGSITNIGNNAFKNCTSLSSLILPNGITSIGDGVFYGCTDLTDLTIPGNVISIGNNAFEGATGFINLIIPDGVINIGGSAFKDCTSLTGLTIPDSVTNIGNNAFKGCTSLSSLILPNGITSIGDGVFYGCTDLTDLTIPGNVISIGNNAFKSCSSLTGLILPESVTTIGDNAFFRCTSLISMTLPDSITSIGDGAFSVCSSLASMTIPDGIKSIGDSAFIGCYSLTSVTLPDSVTSIGEAAFEYCTSLTSLTIPNNVASIGEYAFAECFSLISMTIPDTATSIGHGTFISCSSLSSMTIPDSVTSIGSSAFYNCSSLSNLSIPDSVTSIGNEAFFGCERLSLTIGRDSYAQEYAIINSIPYEFAKVKEMKILRDGKNATGNMLAVDLSANTESIVLQAIAMPSNALQEFTWASSALKVATVDANGQVIVHAKGTATITATAIDGSKKKASCVLDVLALAKEVVVSGENAVASGKKITLSASVLPESADNRKVQWSTSNGNLAAVSDGGVVTAKKVTEASEVVITATAKDGSGVSASHTITIYPLVSQLVLRSENEIFDNKSVIVIDLGESENTRQLMAEASPADSYQSVIWKSSDPKIATVDEAGFVIGLKKGTVTITATASDGTKVKVSVKVNVTYLAKEITITGISELQAGKRTTLKAEVLPVETVNKKVEWSSSDITVATVSAGGVVTAKKVTEPKSVTITATVKDSSGMFSEFMLTVMP